MTDNVGVMSIGTLLICDSEAKRFERRRCIVQSTYVQCILNY